MKWSNIHNYHVDKLTHITVIAGNFSSASYDDIYLLSDSEQQRAKCITNDVCRSRFVASRAFLRRAIGYILNAAPYKGDFFIDKFGKPHFPPLHSTLCFNLSHSGDLIVAAFMQGEAIGIDVEMCNRAIPLHLLRYVFNSDEINQILKSDNWEAAFLRGWTYKEAVLKCIGCGLLLDPKRIQIALNNDGQSLLKATEFSVTRILNAVYRLIPLTHLQDALGVVAIRQSGVVE
ncbi:MAG: 4'-phosphopantetheinyl transferase superfamily protein [Glaciimonas sp.]|nr:4'-phosphopantetheinyl transferase superfamily protein [Glaciimonas sp.]